MPSAAKGTEAKYFFHDGVHPAPKSYHVLAELVLGLLDRALDEAARGVVLPERQHPTVPAAAGMLPPMIPGNHDQSLTFCALPVRWGLAMHCLQIASFVPAGRLSTFRLSRAGKVQARGPGAARI